MVRDSGLVAETRDCESSWSTTCLAISFVVESTCDSFVPVAQWIERLPSKQRVAGSNPARDATSRLTDHLRPLNRAAALPKTEPTFSQDYACGHVLKPPNNGNCLLRSGSQVRILPAAIIPAKIVAGSSNVYFYTFQLVLSGCQG